MSVYYTPNEHNLSLKFPRSRFMKELGAFLYYLSLELVSIGIQRETTFKKMFNKAVRENTDSVATEKTIDNIRTEMTTLFGLVKYQGKYVSRSERIARLAETGDIEEFFKSFCYYFQFPGGFNKEHVIIEQIWHGVKFKPAKTILKLLKSQTGDKECYLTVAETAHLVFNDTRVTVNQDNQEKIWGRIIANRKKQTDYDSTGDVIRYARDFLKYMVAAALLKEKDKRFYFNPLEDEAITKIIESETYFSEYESAKTGDKIDREKLHIASGKWIDYFSNQKEEIALKTTVESIVDISADTIETKITDITNSILVGGIVRRPRSGKKRFVSASSLRKARKSNDKIGAIGELAVVDAEKKKLEEAGKPELAAKVFRVSENASLGYDVDSFLPNGARMFIEVKTTKGKESTFRFPMSVNEWNTAKELKKEYYIYRVSIESRTNIKIFIINDPYRRKREKKLRLEPKDFWVSLRITK